MGCVSSAFLEDEDGNPTPTIGHHIVSLTSTTYGLLSTLDQPTSHKTPPPPPPPPPPRQPLAPLTSSASFFRCRPEAEIINSWDLAAGITPLNSIKLSNLILPISGKENLHRATDFPDIAKKANIFLPSNNAAFPRRWRLDMFENRCPSGGEHAVVLYTTTLRGIRKTFEDCNAVRAALTGLGVWVRERDVSMDLGFREELRRLMGSSPAAVPRVFIKGKYIGGANEVLRIHEEGGLSDLVDGVPKARPGGVCDGCGGARFLPCFRCSGSRKVAVSAAEEGKGSGEIRRRGKVARCPECNENGLVLCPICV